MINLFKPKVTVEQIHKEFDDSEQQVLDACSRLLEETNLTTETRLEQKANLMEEIGFVNSETVKDAAYYKNKREEEAKKIKLAETTINRINTYKINYPNEKIIPISELERICQKYNLIHAPIANYIKDVPEKNLLEIKNSKKLREQDKAGNYAIINGENIDFVKEFEEKYHDYLTEDGCVFMTGFGNYLKIVRKKESTTLIARKVTIGTAAEEEFRDKAMFTDYFIVSKDGYFVAAPKSHFNLDNVDKKSKFGFFSVTKVEVKDPVVFEYLKGDLVRIITKWGTEDDKSYLDDGLINENLN